MHHEFLSSLAPLSVVLPLAEGPFLCTPSDATRTLTGLLPSLLAGQSCGISRQESDAEDSMQGCVVWVPSCK